MPVHYPSSSHLYSLHLHFMPRTEKAQRIPRPPNSFILYRSYKASSLPPPPPGTFRTQGQVSQLISELWNNETPEVKADFDRMAATKKLEHEAKYPHYRYAPRSKHNKSQEGAEGAPGRTPKRGMKSGPRDIYAESDVISKPSSMRGGRSSAYYSSEASFANHVRFPHHPSIFSEGIGELMQGAAEGGNGNLYKEPDACYDDEENLDGLEEPCSNTMMNAPGHVSSLYFGPFTSQSSKGVDDILFHQFLDFNPPYDG